MKIRLEFFLVFVLTFVVYFFTQARNLSLAHDSISYLIELENGVTIFHTHHLLWHITASKFSVWLKEILSIEEAVILLNIFSGSFSVAFCWLYTRKVLQTDIFGAGLSIILIALSYGIWTYSTVLEVYMLSICFFLISFYYISQKHPTTSEIGIGAACLVVAIWMHQQHILFLLPAWLILRKTGNSLRANSIILSVSGIASMGYVTVLLGVVQPESLSEAINWLRGYTMEEKFWNLSGATAIIKPFLGLGRSYIGGHFLLRIPVIEAWAESQNVYYLQDQQYLVNDLNSSDVVLLLISMGVFIFAFIVLSIRGLRRFSWKSVRSLIPLEIGSTLLSYTLFFVFWMPENLEFWLVQSIMLSMLLGRIWYVNRDKVAYFLGISLIVSLFIINYFGSVHWHQQRENDYYFNLVDSWNKQMGTNDLLLLNDPWMIGSYWSKYGISDWVTLDQLEKGQKEVCSYQWVWFYSGKYNREETIMLHQLECNSVSKNQLYRCTCIQNDN